MLRPSKNQWVAPPPFGGDIHHNMHGQTLRQSKHLLSENAAAA
jgi:hypothetical protein